MNELALKIENVSKEYRLGTIGGGTLKAEIQSKIARLRKKDDPNLKIGEKTHEKNERFLALDGINLEIKKGERIGIIGHNGAGKSTLLKLICRVTAPSAGNLYMNGRLTSMLEVGTGFHNELTGRENIYLNGAILGMSKAETDKKIEEIIEFSECRKFIDTPVKRYSSGMKVKLGFSVASHLDSEIMIMDEVLAVGDMAFQAKCLNQMKRVAAEEGRTILYVSHNMETIRNLCSRCIVLDHGKLIFDGDVDEAIAIYLNTRANSDVSKTFETSEKPEWMRVRKMKMLSANYVGKENNTFNDTEKMKLHLEWENLEDVENVGFRFEILTQNRSPVASSLHPDVYSGKKGERGQADIEVSLGDLIASTFSTNYVFFESNGAGDMRAIDFVYGLNFSIMKSKYVKWSPHDWGYIDFKGTEITRIE